CVGAKKAACFVGDTVLRNGDHKCTISQMVVGQRTGTLENWERGAAPPIQTREMNPASWRLIHLRLNYNEGHTLEAVLLRNPEWIASHGVVVGAHLWLDLPHVGVRGQAVVTSVAHCPPIAPGPGRVVTGWFQTTNALVHDLQIEGEIKPIGVTGQHPFWSVDRESWVPAANLHPGERLKGMKGPARVRSVRLRSKPEPVFNIEVEEDHCYRVGEQGLLV